MSSFSFSESADWPLPFLGEHGGVVVGAASVDGEVADRYILLISDKEDGYTEEQARQLADALLQAADKLHTQRNN